MPPAFTGLVELAQSETNLKTEQTAAAALHNEYNTKMSNVVKCIHAAEFATCKAERQTERENAQKLQEEHNATRGNAIVL